MDPYVYPELTRPPGTLAGVDEIQRLCTPVLKKRKYKGIKWVGLFGSYARGYARADSDVNLIAGFKQGVSNAVLGKLESALEHELKEVLKRDVTVDPMVDMEFQGYGLLVALLTSRTIYEVGPWLESNRARGKAYIVEGFDRFMKASMAATRLLRCMDERAISFESFVHEPRLFSWLIDMVLELTFVDHPFEGHFLPATAWITKLKPLVERVWMDCRRATEINDEHWAMLHTFLNRELFYRRAKMVAVMEALSEVRAEMEDIETAEKLFPYAPLRSTYPWGWSKIPDWPLTGIVVGSSLVASGTLLLARLRQWAS